jgi:hypothetical protein
VQKSGVFFNRERILGALVVLAALAAGCGSDGGGESLSREEWIAQADAICAKGARELEALGEPASAAELIELTSNAVEVVERQLAKLRALRPPAEAEADYARMLDLTAEQVEIARKISDAAKDGDAGAIQDLVREGQAVDNKVDAVARKYEFEECGEP